MQRRCSRAEAVVVTAAMAIAGTAACATVPGAAEPDPDVEAIGVATAELNDGSCPDQGCGANSPEFLNGLEFADFRLIGDSASAPSTFPNDQGIGVIASKTEPRKAQIVQGGVSYDLVVVDGYVKGDCRAPCTPLTGIALKGAQITLTVKRKPIAVVYIEDVRPMKYFVGTQMTEAYTLKYQNLKTGNTDYLCNNVQAVIGEVGKINGADDSYRTRELMGMLEWEALMFEGDVYDFGNKTTQPAADDTNVTIACATSLQSKLRLTRNTIHTQDPALPKLWERRQATMKMLAADYCGGGTAMTMRGQRLDWKADRADDNMKDFFHPPDTLEARWNENGAVCLTTPRMSLPTTIAGRDTFLDLKVHIAKACSAAGRPYPKPCFPPDRTDAAGQLRVTGNPPYLPPI